MPSPLAQAGFILRAGRNSPPAVNWGNPKARERLLRKCQQIRCNSGADGIVRMKENETVLLKLVRFRAGYGVMAPHCPELSFNNLEQRK